MPLLRHIFLPQRFKLSERYRPPSGRNSAKIPECDHDQHFVRLDTQWRAIWARRDSEGSETTGGVATNSSCGAGKYLDVFGKPGYGLEYSSLEDSAHDVRVSNVAVIKSSDNQEVVRATIFMSEAGRAVFDKKLQAYATEVTKINNQPCNKRLMDGIENINVSGIESLWTDTADVMPKRGDGAVWCEIWLRQSEDVEGCNRRSSAAVDKFMAVATRLGIPTSGRVLHFPECSVCLAFVKYDELEALMAEVDVFAEFRRAKESAEPYLEMPNKEQAEWADELLSRITFKQDAKVAVTVLDSGAANGHCLLKPVLKDADCQTVEPSWGLRDVDGHGTGMCGLAAYGDLTDRLSSPDALSVDHVLESVKIFNPRRDTPPDLYGEVTQRGVALAEVQAPERTHIGCLAITATDGRDCGKPSSWSGALDQLTSGAMDDVRRLVCVSAGNVGVGDLPKYPAQNITTPVHDPGQSWNALTVGAYTEKIATGETKFKDYKPLAGSRELSPFSSTSLLWDKKWPAKPEIVLEGGNLLVSPGGIASAEDVVSLITTSNQIDRQQFVNFNATSGAAALASRMAAQIQTRYPDAWPETIRGLMVHSARWPEALVKQYMREEGVPEMNKTAYGRLLRFCGYGVPNLETAESCADNLLTLISEAVLKPYKKGDTHSSIVANEMHIYRLPWPVDVLRSLGETEVTIRVTLSYFVEPSPGEKGWNNRYRYPSHGLRFDINNPLETEEAFRARINKAVQADEEGEEGSSGSERWTIGKKSRDVGSIHSDFFTATAADLAACNLIGVYPIGGWWKGRPQFKRYDRGARYSLIVSLQTDAVGVDIYSPVVAQIALSTPVDIPTVNQ